MKILFNGVSAKSGGAVTYVVNLAHHFVSIRSPHRFIFYLPTGLESSINSTNDNVTVIPTTIGTRCSWQRFLWDQFTLRSILKREGIDVLISSSDFGIVFPPCRQVLLIRNALFFSEFYLHNILTYQSWRAKLDFYVRRWLIWLSARFSDVMIMASHTMLKDVQLFARIPDHRAVVNYFGVPLERFLHRASVAHQVTQDDSSKPFRLLHVSTYSDYKNLTTLLKAVQTLTDQGTCAVSLVTTADPWQFPEAEVVSREEDQALATHPQVIPFVKFTGPIPYDSIAQLYADSDLFVFPSLVESFGHPVVEAMASGLPILASDIPICREICGDAAVYFSPLDASDLAEKILLLRHNPHLLQQLAEVGRKRAEVHFDWKDHVYRLMETIEHIATHA